MQKILSLFVLLCFSIGVFSQLPERFQDAKTGKYGFKDAAGKIIVQPIYDNTYFFSKLSPYAPVNIGANETKNEKGKWGVIDKQGKLIIPVLFEEVHHIGYDLFCVAKPAPVEEREEKEEQEEQKLIYALYDNTGNELAPFIHSSINDFYEGMAVVKAPEEGGYTEKAGYIDSTGNLAIPLVYDQAFEFEQGMAIVSKDRNYGVINKQNEAVIPFEYDYLSGYVAINRYAAEKDGKLGFIDLRNKVVIPFNYSSCLFFSEGLFVVSKRLGTGDTAVEKWGYIDVNGKEVIPFIYDDADKFDNGKAKVEINGKKMLIDKTGKVLQ